MTNRIDVELVNRGLFESRQKAQLAIQDKIIEVNGIVITKPSFKTNNNDIINIIGEKLKYVSKGGLKLEKALDVFDVSLNNKIMLDIGSSTGGFTDCALKNDVAFVYCIDVGTNQLALSLRDNMKIKLMEKTNFRVVTEHSFDCGYPDIATIDVSFISLEIILSKLSEFFYKNEDIIALIKPQFECGKENLNKNGIVKDYKTHLVVINNVINYATNANFSIIELTHSPITGGDGNIEYLAHFKANECSNIIDIESIVETAFKQLKGGKNND